MGQSQAGGADSACGKEAEVRGHLFGERPGSVPEIRQGGSRVNSCGEPGKCGRENSLSRTAR